VFRTLYLQVIVTVNDYERSSKPCDRFCDTLSESIDRHSWKSTLLLKRHLLEVEHSGRIAPWTGLRLVGC